MILNTLMKDGSRHFATIEQRVLWKEMSDSLAALPGAKQSGYYCDDITEGWIDFSLEGHEFSINDQLGEYWLFVKDPNCPEELLDRVATHFSRINRAG